MKSRETTLRLMRFSADEKARKTRDLELMIQDLAQIASDLERQIRTEEDRTGIRDAGHYAYSTFAKAARQRRENVEASIGDLKAKLDQAASERDEALDDLQKSEAADVRSASRERHRGAAMAKLTAVSSNQDR